MKRFIKKHRKAILTVVAAIAAYILLHKIGTAERGYEAIGGEIFALLIPVFVWLAPSFKEVFKVVNDNAVD